MQGWKQFYEEEWHFVVTMVVLILMELVLIYLVSRTVHNFWFNKKRTMEIEGKDIQSIIKFMTLLYLILLLLYVTSSLVVRVVVAFSNQTIYCWIADSMTLWFVGARITAHFIYLIRLAIVYFQVYFFFLFVCLCFFFIFVHSSLCQAMNGSNKAKAKSGE